MKLKVSFGEIKRDALDSLSGFWKTAFAIVLTNLAIVIAAAFPSVYFREYSDSLLLSFLFSCLFSLVSCFLRLGFQFCMLKFSRNDIPRVSDMFRVKQFYPKYLLIILILYAGGTVCYTLLGGLMLAVISLLKSNIPAAVLLFLLVLAGLYALCLLRNGFLFAEYLLIDNPHMKLFRLLKVSWHLMKGNKNRYILFTLSFIGWLLLVSVPTTIAASLSIVTLLLGGIMEVIGFFCSGIAGICLFAYLMVAKCCFYNHLVLEYKSARQKKEPPADSAVTETASPVPSVSAISAEKPVSAQAEPGEEATPDTAGTEEP